MNILYITNHLNVGGITNYVLTLAKGLKGKGHNVYIASSGGDLFSKFIEQGITYIPIPIKTKSEISPKILASMLKLSMVIKQNNIDILHSNSRTTGVLGCLVSRNTAVTHISTCHGFFKTRVFRKMFPCWGRKVIAISESVRDHLIDDFKVRKENIRVIHSGVDVNKFKIQNSKFKVDLKKNLGLGNGLVVGIVARLSEEKGHIYLIEAMKNVLDKFPSTQLLIVGDGRMKNELVDLSKRLGIEQSVVFIPSFNDTVQILSIIDIFVLPSLKEGLGLSLMEAMAAGLAVIGSDVGGIRSLIKDGYNGLLVKPADSKDLANVILELLQNPHKREFLGNNARIFIEDNFSQERMVSETLEVYRECINVKD